MTKAPEVSIVMPVRNAALFLTECIESILQQSFENWELIAVDDFSDDESYSILQDYSEKNTRIKSFRGREKGIISSLQQALEHTVGTYITRMDADDIMPVDKLIQLYSALKEKGLGYVSTGLVKMISSAELMGGFMKYEHWLNRLTKNHNNFSEIYKECVVPSPCWMMHRQDFFNCGGFDTLEYPEDYDLCFRWFAAGIKVVGVNTVLHLWRDHPKRASRTDSNYKDQLFLRLKWKYFRQLEFSDHRELVIWGAGKKAKQLIHVLIEDQVDFRWICDNSNKIGHTVYEVKIEGIDALDTSIHQQIIVMVSNEEDQQTIQRILEGKELEQNKDFYLFC